MVILARKHLKFKFIEYRHSVVFPWIRFFCWTNIPVDCRIEYFVGNVDAEHIQISLYHLLWGIKPKIIGKNQQMTHMHMAHVTIHIVYHTKSPYGLQWKLVFGTTFCRAIGNSTKGKKFVCFWLDWTNHFFYFQAKSTGRHFYVHNVFMLNGELRNYIKWV